MLILEPELFLEQCVEVVRTHVDLWNVHGTCMVIVHTYVHMLIIQTVSFDYSYIHKMNYFLIPEIPSATNPDDSIVQYYSSHITHTC